MLLVGLPPEPGAASHRRTTLISGAPGLVADGPSRQAAMSADGRLIAFTSLATNLGGSVPGASYGSIYTRDRVDGTLRLHSAAAGGLAANGDSTEPTLGGRGVVGWTSSASNLVAADTNGVADVFVRFRLAPALLVSVAADGGPANGPSSQPTLSADGRHMAFSSLASNLVPGDTNGVCDVFVRDLVGGRTTRASVASPRRQSSGHSTHPALSEDGRVVSFSSLAPDLVSMDTNATRDVFVRDLSTSRTLRVTVSSSGRQQNRSVAGPFAQVSSLSEDGRYVAFDSDATNLVRRDRNRSTDVFVHDRRRGVTVMASLSSSNVQGNSDSFSPTLSGDGRHVAFSSFAGNIAPDDPPEEDIMLRDLGRQLTAVVDVPSDGTRKEREPGRQLLQRPALSRAASVVAFISGAPNLVDGDVNESRDVFVRDMDPPRTRARLIGRAQRRAVFALSSSNRHATSFLCRIDRRAPVRCGPGRFRAAPLAPGPHRLLVRAGGPGMQYDPSPVTIRFAMR